MIIFIYGKEEFLILERSKQLKEAFLKKYKNATCCNFDFEESLSIEEVQAALLMEASLFSVKSLFIFRGLNFLNAIQIKNLKGILKEFSSRKNGNVLIVEGSNIKKKTVLNFFNEIADQSEEKKTMSAMELERWVDIFFKKESGGALSIDSFAKKMLIDSYSKDLFYLKNELLKLLNFKERGIISADDVESLASLKINVGIFELSDSIAQLQKGRALFLKNKLLLGGENEFFVFSMLVAQLRNIMKIRTCFDSGIKRPDEIAKMSNLHPFVVKKIFSQIKKFDKRRIKKAFSLMATLDKSVKNGQLPMSEAIDELIIRI